MLIHDDCLKALKKLDDNSIDSCVTDPPYALVSIVKRFGSPNAAPAKSNGATGVYTRASSGFMGQQWDTGEVAFSVEFWQEVYRVLKPGGYVLAFGGTRTYHRLACAVEDAGFEIRDQIMWVYGSGFPKSHDVSKGIDAKLLTGGARTKDMRKLAMGEDYKPSGRGRTNYDHGGGSVMNGATNKQSPQTKQAAEWEGWGTALKPAHEPIVMARKPLIGTVAENVLKHGTGAINIDGCRIAAQSGAVELGSRCRDGEASADRRYADKGSTNFAAKPGLRGGDPAGRWPANFIHDGSDEVLEHFPQIGSGNNKKPYCYAGMEYDNKDTSMFNGDKPQSPSNYNDKGSAARFFYCAKASKSDREQNNNHPTVKPTDLMRYLCRLVTPPGGTVLDPFMGSGSTGKAAKLEGFEFIGIEREKNYYEIAKQRIENVEVPSSLNQFFE